MNLVLPNLFQSTLRRDIQEVYGHEIFTCILGETPYWGVVKKKSFGPLSLSWLQVLGVRLEDIIDRGYSKKTIYQTFDTKGLKHSPFFLQVGINTPLTVIEKPLSLTPSQIVAVKKTKYEAIDMLSHQGFHPTIKENMPPSTIVLEVTKSDAELFSAMSGQAYRYIQKAQKKGVHYRCCTSVDDLNVFYDYRVRTANQKGFFPITKKQFTDLATYLWGKNTGSIMLGLLGNRVVSGGVFLEYEHALFYLYGFSSRDDDVRNIGGHYGLMWYMLQIARKKGLTLFDLLGGSPTGEENHFLAGVGKFKESLGGRKIEYYGSFDFVFNRWLYMLFTLKQKVKKLKVPRR